MTGDFAGQKSRAPRCARRKLKGRCAKAPKGSLTVHIYKRSRRVPLSRAEIEKLARMVAADSWFSGGEVDIVFADNREISELNRKFLGRDGPTDVITFHLEDAVPERGDKTVGEIVISTDMALAEAGRRDKQFRDELALYLVHGLLHLARHDDANDRQRRKMYRHEENMLTEVGFSYNR